MTDEDQCRHGLHDIAAGLPEADRRRLPIGLRRDRKVGEDEIRAGSRIYLDGLLWTLEADGPARPEWQAGLSALTWVEHVIRTDSDLLLLKEDDRWVRVHLHEGLVIGSYWLLADSLTAQLEDELEREKGGWGVISAWLLFEVCWAEGRDLGPYVRDLLRHTHRECREFALQWVDRVRPAPLLKPPRPGPFFK